MIPRLSTPSCQQVVHAIAILSDDGGRRYARESDFVSKSQGTAQNAPGALFAKGNRGG